jgi:hypothetical protein
MLSCAKARATGSQTCTRRSGLRAMTCPSVTADVGNLLHRARPRWAIAKFCADIVASRVGGGSPGCRGGGGGCVSGCVGHCGLGAGYVARYAAVVFRVSRYVYVSVDVSVQCDRSPWPCATARPCAGVHRSSEPRTDTMHHTPHSGCVVRDRPDANTELPNSRAVASRFHRGPWWIQMGRDDGVLDLGKLYIHTS